MANGPTSTRRDQAQQDLVSAPFTEDELATIRELRHELRKSNLGPEQHAAEVLESREKNERHRRQSRKSFHEHMGKAYTAVVSALARNEAADLRHAMGIEGGDEPSTSPNLIKQVLNYGGELPPDMLSRRGAAIRWALASGCTPAGAPAFFKQEGGVTGCAAKWSKANAREPALNAAATSQGSVQGGRDRDRSTVGGKPATENGTAGPAATPTLGGTSTAPVAQDRPVAVLTCTAVQFHKNMLRDGQAGVLRGRFWFDGEQLFVRTLSWSAKESGAPSRPRATRPEAQG